ncbi:hypothetical protein ACFVXE_36445 [Streptomyces sp. NPDC058231]|uniref:hypothetical protein n=1 Tax=Streptomyces sp. NPDC058231 TaxID=3346392 RepID=UPI0036E8B742
MFNLGVLLHEEGDAEGCRAWWSRAADAGNTDVMAYLGLLLHEEGDTEGARAWWTSAADDGHADAQAALFALGIVPE